ncbi:MAG: hypothetical protein K8E24_004575, partial [Methanobacterium paludis]|nr:hypothetical protein [Methanobacterium paludis]
MAANELINHDIPVKGFVWGYYKHGFFSPNVNQYIRNNYNGKFNLSNVNGDKTSEIPENLFIFIYNVISKFKKYFVKNRESFLKWIYSEKTPIEYRP